MIAYSVEKLTSEHQKIYDKLRESNGPPDGSFTYVPYLVESVTEDEYTCIANVIVPKGTTIWEIRWKKVKAKRS